MLLGNLYRDVSRNCLGIVVQKLPIRDNFNHIQSPLGQLTDKLDKSNPK